MTYGQNKFNSKIQDPRVNEVDSQTEHHGWYLELEWRQLRPALGLGEVDRWWGIGLWIYVPLTHPSQLG